MTVAEFCRSRGMPALYMGPGQDYRLWPYSRLQYDAICKAELSESEMTHILAGGSVSLLLGSDGSWHSDWQNYLRTDSTLTRRPLRGWVPA